MTNYKLFWASWATNILFENQEDDFLPNDSILSCHGSGYRYDENDNDQEIICGYVIVPTDDDLDDVDYEAAVIECVSKDWPDVWELRFCEECERPVSTWRFEFYPWMLDRMRKYWPDL